MKHQAAAHAQQQSSLPLLEFSYNQIRPTCAYVRVTIPKVFVERSFAHAAQDQKKVLHAEGFHKGEVPLGYIEKNFVSALVDHVQEFLFTYFVTPFLYKEIHKRKILVSGEPRLKDIYIENGSDGHFDFELSTFTVVALPEWRYFPFKAPKRKKYKDLDRQVDDFVKEEKKRLKEHKEINHIQENDWVQFSIEPIDQKGSVLFEHEPLMLWVKMGNEPADEQLRNVFVGKSAGDSFVSNNSSLQKIFTQDIQTNYAFLINILDVLHDHFFCLELFKRHFKLKTNKHMLQKLIEVFSYRNDISQRRAMTEQALALLLQKHAFDVPQFLVTRHKEQLLERISHNPDYHVYRMQSDFQERVEQLARKQVKEILLLDQLAYEDNLIPSDVDVKAYLNLTNRPRAKEFIYFDPPITRIQGKEAPLCAEELRRICMREKTINHIIYHLTKL